METVGGHQDIAAGSKIAIVVVPLVRGRIATIVDRVTTLVTYRYTSHRLWCSYKSSKKGLNRQIYRSKSLSFNN
ncbi:citrate lyase subunit alpha [Cetobacterium sp. SF1]|uniref:citrate lyase subunit alpha n=1 Tax=Cetobacterium sp. SF1 TaxID=3417654 RepID=UPI003CE7919D